MRVAVQDDIKSLNPIVVGDVWSWNVLQWIYDRPTRVDYDSNEIMPYIAVGSANLSGKAESWDDCTIGNFGYSPQSTWEDASKQEAVIFYDFTNITWHDGTPMTIRDVMFSMHMAAQVPEWSGFKGPMDTLKAYNFTQTSWLHIYKVWEDGDRAALRFQLQTPYADFFRSTISTLLLPYHIWGSTTSGQNVDGAKIWCDPGYNVSATDSWKVAPVHSYENHPPIGSGLFKFDFWIKGQMSKILTFREHFYGSNYSYKEFIEANFPEEKVKLPTIDSMTFKLYKTAEHAVWALKNDNVDYISWSIPPSFVYDIAKEPGITLYSIPESGFYYLGYNMCKQSFGYNASASFPYEPEDDLGKPLRRAIAHCIDKTRIVQRLLLNLGDEGVGPVPPSSEWHNSSVPTYDFNPQKAKQILADAGYLVKKTDGTLAMGEEAIAVAGLDNWWVNPDGSNIGSGSGGNIEILTPEANYDPIRAQFGLMLAQQLRDIGIYTGSIAMDFGSIVGRIDNRNYDMYILGWHINSDPTDYLWSFYHSDNIVYGQNYAGYQNKSFDDIIDWARETENKTERKQLVFDAQAAICYDLPNDIVYYRKTVLAARTDRLSGWVLQNGGVFNRASIMNLRGPFLYKLIAKFNHPTSAVYSNSTTPLSALVTGDGGAPIEGAAVKLNASIGTLSVEQGLTNIVGSLSTSFTAPYVPPTPENIKNGTPAFIQITSATTDLWEYSSAPPRFILVTVFPEEAKFISVRMLADPNVIEDVGADMETPGFTIVDVEVKDQDGVVVPGALVNLTTDSGALDISPFEMLADQDGKARFTVTAANLMINDGSISEFVLTAQAIIVGSDTILRSQNHITVQVLDAVHPPIPEQPIPSTGPVTFVVVALLAAIAYVAMNRRKRR
ncbi:MAG: hypothetical protein KKH41_02585 [Candidatus Thermoplasmatota archaeon]|nr:hypothetical protein [Candidatus Thermoplasmatota archaeon]